MLNGATKIIGDVPGKHLDPLLLAQSQWNDATGYMVIAYNIMPVIERARCTKFYDFFFLRGSHISGCARLNSDLRFHIRLDEAVQTFRQSGKDDNTRVFLFAAQQDCLDRFSMTFLYESCLKLQISGLSAKRISTLLVKSGCPKGIVECNDFSHLLPSVDLQDITGDTLARYQPAFRHGCLLLYDTERNRELVEGKFASRPSAAIPLVQDDETRPTNPVQSNSTDKLLISLPKKDADELTQFISDILQIPTPEGSDNRQDSNPTPRATGLVTIVPIKPLQSAPTKSVDHASRANLPSGRSSKSSRSAGLDPRVGTGMYSTNQNGPPGSSDYVHLFERLFRSFRQQLFDCIGEKADAAIAAVQGKVQLLNPEFNHESLTEETAIITLDLIEKMFDEVSFLKRSRLKQAALTIISDLYTKQYEILEAHKVIDKVEEFYYRLKR